MGEGSFLSQLLATLAKEPHRGTAAFAECFHALLRAATQAHGGEAIAAPFANGLALGCVNFLPQLWHWLAMQLGLPIEAPLQARDQHLSSRLGLLRGMWTVHNYPKKNEDA